MGFVNQPLTNEAARKLMALDVQDKEILTYEKLDEWYTAWGGQCYVSFSGGKDSTVLAYLAARYLASFRTPPWELNLVFVNCDRQSCSIWKAPAADAAPVVHGRWISFLDGDHIMPERYYRCSRCGRVESRRQPYCHCGAKMDGVE